MATIRPDSEVRLIKNVPFFNNYRDVIRFDNKTNQESYFKGLPNLSISNYKYVRASGSIKVPYYRDEILEYNYMMFKNKAYGDKYFYAFITDISYINPNTSLVTFEIDVWQTWYLSISYLPSYIEREHCKRWNSDGSPVINTIPEKLDFGSEYVVKGIKHSYNADVRSQIKWLVIGVSFDKENFYTETDYLNVVRGFGTSTNLGYVVFPINEYGMNDNSWLLNGIGMEDALLTLMNFRYELFLVNKMVCCYITDFLPFTYSVESVQSEISITSDYIRRITCGFDFTDEVGEHHVDFELPFIYTRSNDGQRTQPIDINFTDKYSTLKSGITESKLLMYPYSFNLLTDFQGDNFIIKNEYVNGNNIQMRIRSGINTSNKVTYTVRNYLNSNVVGDVIYLDNGIINNHPNTLSIVSDYEAAFSQGNANQISNIVAQAQLQAENNNRIALNNANTRSDVTDMRNVEAMTNAGIGAVGGVGTGGMFGIGGALAGAITGIGDITSTGVSNTINSAVTTRENINNLANTKLTGELNKQLAINSAMAKYQDARNMADNVALHGGDVAFNYGYENMGCHIISKQITPEYVALLTDYFEKYGYAVHRVKIPNIHTRKSWNYIQTVGARVKGNIPQMYLDSIETILNNGVTIWHTTDVGNFNLNNDEI